VITPEIGPLRLRLFADGAMVIDNPANPVTLLPSAQIAETMMLDAAVAKNLPLFLQSIAKAK
jgi:hypothetical protein